MKSPNEWLLELGISVALAWQARPRITLDAISAMRPIAIWQRLCHEFILNRAGLRRSALPRDMTKGKGAASEQVNWQEGHFWEMGLNLMVGPMLKVLATPERVAFGLKQMVAYEQANGVTAYNEPGALYTPDMWKLYEHISACPIRRCIAPFSPTDAAFPTALVSTRRFDATEEQIAVAPEGAGRETHVFTKQIKLFADGAIISQLMQMKDGYLDGHKGEWIMLPNSSKSGPSSIGMPAISCIFMSMAILASIRRSTCSNAACAKTRAPITAP